MSGFEHPPLGLGAKNQARARPLQISGGDRRLAEHVEAELRVTFEIDELTRFFGGFADLDAQEVYRLVCEVA